MFIDGHRGSKTAPLNDDTIDPLDRVCSACTPTAIHEQFQATSTDEIMFPMAKAGERQSLDMRLDYPHGTRLDHIGAINFPGA